MAKEILAYQADLLQYWALSLPSNPQTERGSKLERCVIASQWSLGQQMRVPKTRFFKTILLLALFLGPWLPGDAGATDTLVLPDDQELAIRLQPYVKVYEDRTGRLDFDQIRELEEENPNIFQPTKIGNRAVSHPLSAWWLHATIVNRSDPVRELRLVAGPPNLESVDFYLSQAGAIQHTRAGTLVPILRQQDMSAFPTLRFNLSRGEAVQIWIKIKSHSPLAPTPVLYTKMLFGTAATTTTIADGLLIGALWALGWCMLLIAIVLRCMPFLWLSTIAAAAGLREAATREYLQRLLWPLDTAWGYRLELTLDAAYMVLFALFIHSVARRDTAPIAGARIYPRIAAALYACLLLALLLRNHIVNLPIHTAMWTYQGLAYSLAACLLGSAILLARRTRPATPAPLARRTLASSILLGLSAVFVIADTAIRTTGSPLSEPLLSVSFILDSGSPPVALLTMGGTLTVLTLWAARQLRRRRSSEPTEGGPRTAQPQIAPAGTQSPATDPASISTSTSTSPLTLTSALASASASVLAPPETAISHPDAPPAPTMAAASYAPVAAPDIADRQAMILSYVGHDLRAPLAIISGYIRLLRQAAAPAQHNYLDVIERSVAHQFSLIEEILAYGKAELQPFTLSPRDIDLPALLEELAHFGVALCTHQRNSFQYLPAPTLPAVVSLDARRLRQAVLNLLSNASKFTSDGTVRFEAYIRRNSRPQPELHLSVFNDGPHIPKQDQNGIFLAFHQLHRRESGGGLGLFIVERIVHAMGGVIGVESSPERGNRFSLTIPIRITSPTVVATRPIERAPVRSTYVPQLEAPPLAVRLALSALARDGELSEIENWVADTRAVYPQYTTFYSEVAKCVETFDMECLQRLALQGMA
jgi:signal transduction histidine kinase